LSYARLRVSGRNCHANSAFGEVGRSARAAPRCRLDGTGAGGGLDTNGRIVARHLAKHIPGEPVIVPKNMPGAGHIRAANYVFSQAPKDGTTIGTFIPIFVMAQVLERSKSIQFNPADFQWLVSTSSSNSTVYVWSASGVKTIEDAMRRQVIMGATGVGSYTMIYPLCATECLSKSVRQPDRQPPTRSQIGSEIPCFPFGRG
jgi:hypothetical protein